jgi:DNA-binding NarL/FixJ family response regulator
MDIRMPELDGLQATRRILAASDTVRIVILTTFDLDEYVYEALSAGASGFVLKDDPPEQLVAAIRIIAAGNALLSPAITKRVIKQFVRGPRPRPPRQVSDLTERELEVFARSRVACPIRDRRRALSSARQPSKPTSRTYSRSSTFAIASRLSCSPTRPAC